MALNLSYLDLVSFDSKAALYLEEYLKALLQSLICTF